MNDKVCASCDRKIPKGFPIVVRSIVFPFLLFWLFLLENKIPVMFKLLLPIHINNKVQRGLVATRDYKVDESICVYGGKTKYRWTEKSEIMDKSYTIGMGHEVLDGKNSTTLGPYINSGVKRLPLFGNNVKKLRHMRKGAPQKGDNGATVMPLFASKEIHTGDEFFLPYGSSYNGYQSNTLFTREDAFETADQFHFRECITETEREFRPLAEAYNQANQATVSVYEV